MADNGHSSKYSTDRSRREHTLGLWRYASTKAAMKFSCAGMRSVCASRPCSGCPIETVNGHESAEDMALSVGLLIKDGGYVKLGKERDIRLSNFTLDPQNVFMQTDYTGQKVRTSTQMEVSVEGIPAGVVRFSEEGWKGKAAMLDQISGLGNAFFVGSDTDVQLLKYLTYHEGRDMGEVIEVFSAGIHIHKVAGKSRRVYVEPSGSITEHQVRDTHQLSGEIPAAPRVLDSVMTPPGDLATQEVLKNLLQVNAPDVVSQVLGWFCAAHLRRHFMELEGQFPVLSLWGSAESGKTRTASLFGHLNGCDYAMQDAPVSLPTIKEFGLVMQCASSTTVPRILDEYNRGRMNANRFNMVTDILISSWNALSVSRGTISAASRRINGSGRTGATSVNIPLTAPLCVLSEQRPSVTALVHRSLQVGLSTQTREGRDHQFNYAFRGRELLIGFSKAMVLQSLRTPDSWVREKMDLVDCLVPKGVQDRARYTYKVAMVGLILFEEVCLGLNLDLSEEIASLRQGREVHLESNEVAIVAEKGRSEIDVVMESLALMAHSTAVSQQMGGHEAWLYAGHHYVVDQGFLYFQPMSVFSAYQRYAKLHGLDVHMPSSRAFSELLRQERYVVRTDATHQLMPGQSGLVEIDMDKVKEKGLHEFADLFRSAYDVAS